jgi:hypothetical protein
MNISVHKDGNNNIEIPHKQRALILQDGGALGAFETRAFKTLCDKIKE